jgi:Tautomerase enzyme
VIVQITASNWRDAATRNAFYKQAADLLAGNPGLHKEDLQITFSPNQREDWCFGNGVPASARRREALT